MKSTSPRTYASVDDYVATQEGEVRERLTLFCKIVRQVAPNAEARISYGMPAFFLNGSPG